MRFLKMAALCCACACASPLAAQSGPFEAARGLPLGAGQWSYAQSVDGSEARFGASLAIRCVRAARLVNIRRLDPGAAAPLTIATDVLARTLPASGTLGASDPLLDAIAFSRGRLVISAGGAQRLIIPASPEAARSIEDCRN